MVKLLELGIKNKWFYFVLLLFFRNFVASYEKNDIDQFITSVASEMVDKQDLKQKIVDKWSIKPSLAEKLVDILEFVADKGEFTTEQVVSHFGFNATTAKRYLRQLTEFGYLEAHGGNKNRTYTKRLIERCQRDG